MRRRTDEVNEDHILRRRRKMQTTMAIAVRVGQTVAIPRGIAVRGQKAGKCRASDARPDALK